MTPPAGGGQGGNPGGGGGEDLEVVVVDSDNGELRWGVGVSTPAGVQAQVTFGRRDFPAGR